MMGLAVSWTLLTLPFALQAIKGKLECCNRNVKDNHIIFIEMTARL